jgi:ribonuclease HI
MFRWIKALLPPLQVYTDGSLKEGRGSWAFIVVQGQKIQTERFGKARHTTSNRMEFQAAIEALKFLPADRRLIFHTDSRVLLEALRQLPLWRGQNWLKSGDRKIPSVDQMQELDRLIADRKIEWRWVKAHAGVAFNERCDELCILARQNLRV